MHFSRKGEIKGDCRQAAVSKDLVWVSQNVILGWRRIICIHKWTNLDLRGIPGVFSRIWSALLCAKERSEIE